MQPYINIFGRNIGTYGIVGIIGFGLGLLVVLYLCKYYKIKRDDAFYCFLYAAIGVLIGAKLLYFITNIPTIISNWDELIHDLPTLATIAFGGLVFYGGLLGGVFGIWAYCKQFKLPFKDMILTAVPVVPLVHGIGRIGCFFAGCCYGIEYNGWGSVTFQNAIDPVANGVPRLPVQLIEAGCNIIIFIILICLFKKFLNTYKTLGIYCILYSIVRFVLEFFRGDAVRGVWFGISTSQIISIGIFIVGIVILVKEFKGKGKTENKETVMS